MKSIKFDGNTGPLWTNLSTFVAEKSLGLHTGYSRQAGTTETIDQYPSTISDHARIGITLNCSFWSALIRHNKGDESLPQNLIL